MKVSEILKESGDNIKTHKNEHAPSMHGKKALGSGTAATVYRADKLNNAIKVLDITAEKSDGTYRYIDMVMDNQDNPYFPKIYKADLYEFDFPVEVARLVIEMEKLVAFDNEKAEHYWPILFKQFGITEERALELYYGSTIEKPETHEDDIFAEALFDLFWTVRGRKELVKNIKNKQLAEAIQKTGKILDSQEHGDGKRDVGDLHSGNMMMRLTGNIPQLVIVDPILTMH